jgi:P-type Ca2+ transporter type 2C
MSPRSSPSGSNHVTPPADATDAPQGLTDAYRQSAVAIASSLGTDPQRGLGEAEARARLDRYGRNELEAEKPAPAWRRFLAQFQDVLVILLLVATAISAGLWAYERDAALPYEALAILIVVAVNAQLLRRARL